MGVRVYKGQGTKTCVEMAEEVCFDFSIWIWIWIYVRAEVIDDVSLK